jgi:hypothetical protein
MPASAAPMVARQERASIHSRELTRISDWFRNGSSYVAITTRTATEKKNGDVSTEKNWKMGAPIHVTVIDTGSTSNSIKNFRIIPPPDTHLTWTDRDLTCLAVNMARCAVRGVVRTTTRVDVAMSNREWRTDNRDGRTEGIHD